MFRSNPPCGFDMNHRRSPVLSRLKWQHSPGFADNRDITATSSHVCTYIFSCTDTHAYTWTLFSYAVFNARSRILFLSVFTIFTSTSMVHPSEVNLGATTRSYYRVGWALIPIFQSTYRARPTPHGLSKASRGLTRVKGKINKPAQKPGFLSLSLSLSLFPSLFLSFFVLVLNALAYASIPIPACLST